MSLLRRLLGHLHDRRDDERGLTLAEVLVASALSIVVMTIVTSAFASTHRLFRAADAEYVGQTDVRTTIERLGRDLRDARSVDAGATGSQLKLWIDANSDYVEQPTEVVTWQIVLRPDGVHYDVTRTVAATTTRTAQFVISAIAFQYRSTSGGATLATPLSVTDAGLVRLVSADVVYRPAGTDMAKNRHTYFTERLRNVA